MKSSKKKLCIAAVCAIAAALPFACSTALTETCYNISVAAAKNPVKIAFLSDLHNSFYKADMRELTESVHNFSPDAVVFGGDLFDEHFGEENSWRLVKKLSEEYPCYYSIGNHELNRMDADRVKEKMRETGVIVLEGGFSDIMIGDTAVRFIGIDGAQYEKQREAAKKAVSIDRVNLLINHFPEDFPLVSGKGFDIVLSGHAHGGQVRIPFTDIGLYAPGQGVFPKYTSGVYTEDSTSMVVSRGLYRQLSCILIPRVFNRPEAVYITIQP